jgi:hypothetical protein
MARHKYQGTFKDGNGMVVGTATTANATVGTISVYLAGGTTAADVYAAETGGSAVNSVSTDEDGFFEFWVDDTEYTENQRFKITLTHADFEDKTYDDLDIIKFKPVVVDAKWYGFSPSATAAVNATAIGSALTAAGTGGTVEVSVAGTYSCNAFTISNSRVTLRTPYGQGNLVNLSYSGTSDFITVSGTAVTIDGFLLTGPDGAAAAGDVGIKISDQKSRCVVQNCVLNDWDVGIEDDGFLNKIISNTINDFTTYGYQKDSTSSGFTQHNYITTSKGGSESAIYINGGHHESYSDVIGNCDKGFHFKDGKSLIIIGAHIETPTTADIYSEDASCTIHVMGGRMEGTFRSGESGSNATRWILDGTTFETAPTFSNSTYARIIVRNCGSFTLDDITATVEHVSWSDAENIDNSTTNAVTSGTGEDDLRSATITQYTHNSYAGFKVYAAGDKTGANGNKTLKWYWGTTAVTFHAAANDTNDWQMEATCLFQDNDDLHVMLRGYNDTTLVQHYSKINGEDLGAGNITTKITGECAHADDVITQSMWRVELIRKT